MLELLPLQEVIDAVPAEPTWAWLSDWDGEAKWGVIGYMSTKAHDVLKDWVAAWRDVERTRLETQ